MAVLNKLFDVRRDEWPRFGLLFAAFFIFNVGMAWASTSTSAVLVTLEGGEEFLSLGFVFYGIATIVVSIVYTAVVDRLPKHFLLVVMTAIALLLVVANAALFFVPSLRTPAAIALFVLYKVIVLVWVLQWKTNLLDFYDTRTSKRILPLLGTARLLGFAVGSFLITVLVEQFGVPSSSFFGYWAVTLLLVLLIVWGLPRLLRDPKPEPSEARGGYLDSIREGFRFIGNSRFLRWMAFSALLMNAQIALFEIFSRVLVSQELGGDAQAVASFFATIDGIFSALLLLVQLFIFPRILKVLGLGRTNLLYPITAFGMSGAIMLATMNLLPSALNLIVGAGAYINIETFRRVFRTPVNGLLVNAVPPFMKGRARSVINGILSPFANIAIGLASLIQVIPGTSITGNDLFFWLIPIVSFVYVLSAVALRREYGRSMLQLLQSADYAALLSQDYGLGLTDTETLKQLRARLDEEDDPAIVGFMAGVLLEAGGEEAVPLVVDYAHHATTEQRRAVLEVLVNNAVRGDAVRMLYIAHAESEDVLSRRLALRGLMQITRPDEDVRYVIAKEHVHDTDPFVRGEMARVMLHAETIGERDKGQRVLRAMIGDYHDEVRLAAAQALVASGDVEVIKQLVILMEDDNDAVRLEATQGICELWRDDLPAELVQLVLDREKMLLDDPVERIRQVELTLLGKIGNELAASTLVRALLDRSPMIRKSAIEALVGMGNPALPPLQQAAQSDNPSLRRYALMALMHFDPKRYDDVLLHAIHETLDALYENAGNIAALEVCEDYPSFALLRVQFEEDNRALLADVFEMLRTLYDPAAVNTIHETLQSTDKRTYNNAVEALESLSTPDLARRIAPFFEPGSTPHGLAALHSEDELPTSEEALKKLVTEGDAWLRSLTVMALGEMSAHHGAVKALLLNDPDIPPTPAEQLSACQQAISPDFAAVTIRMAFSSHEEDVRRTGRAALRLVRGESILDSLDSEAIDSEDTTMLSTIERMIYLKHVSFFQPLPVEQLKALASICEEQQLAKGETLFSQGDETGSLYVVVSGRVEVGLMTEDQEMFTRLAEYGNNTAFGEMSLLDGQPRSADAIAAEDTLLLSVRREPFLALTRQYPDLSLHLVTMLSQRLRDANAQIARMSSTE